MPTSHCTVYILPQQHNNTTTTQTYLFATTTQTSLFATTNKQHKHLSWVWSTQFLNYLPQSGFEVPDNYVKKYNAQSCFYAAIHAAKYRSVDKLCVCGGEGGGYYTMHDTKRQHTHLVWREYNSLLAHNY